MNRFFAPHLNEQNKEYHLESDESRHCIKVLRNNVGDKIELINGKGLLATANISEIKKKSECILSIESYQIKENYPYTHLAIAPTKNADKIEWLVEKASELGIQKISFLNCQNNERRKINYSRLDKIIVSSAKQSGRLHLLKIEESISFTDFIEKHPTGLIAHCRNSKKESLSSIQNQHPILIGPEGDFIKEEVELAIKSGYQAISLGKQRLRTETAGIAACVIMAKNAGILDGDLF